MARRRWKALAATATALALVPGALLGGYYAHKLEIAPVHGFVERWEHRIAKRLGRPPEIVEKFARI